MNIAWNRLLRKRVHHQYRKARANTQHNVIAIALPRTTGPRTHCRNFSPLATVWDRWTVATTTPSFSCARAALETRTWYISICTGTASQTGPPSAPHSSTRLRGMLEPVLPCSMDWPQDCRSGSALPPRTPKWWGRLCVAAAWQCIRMTLDSSRPGWMRRRKHLTPRTGQPARRNPQICA